MQAFTVAERPDLTEPAWELTRDLFPEYNNHGDVLNRYWGRLTEELPEFQFHFVGDDAESWLAPGRFRCAGTVPSPTCRRELTARSRAGSTRALRTRCARS